MEYAEKDFTPWFDGAIHKPSRPGVYHQRGGGVGREIGYQYWDGKRWYNWSSTVEGAMHLYSVGCCASAMYQSDDWRGIVESAVTPRKYSIVRVIAQTIETSDIAAYAKEHDLQGWEIIELDSHGKTL